MTFRIPAALTAVLLSLFTFACSAQSSNGSAFVEGKHYKEVREVADPADNERIAVEEFFWYGCSHCYNFESTLEPWAERLPADVDFARDKGCPAPKQARLEREPDPINQIVVEEEVVNLRAAEKRAFRAARLRKTCENGFR